VGRISFSESRGEKTSFFPRSRGGTPGVFRRGVSLKGRLFLGDKGFGGTFLKGPFVELTPLDNIGGTLLKAPEIFGDNFGDWGPSQIAKSLAAYFWGDFLIGPKLNRLLGGVKMAFNGNLWSI